MIRVRVVVTGRVQGVWYRQSCRDVALDEGVRGWVRNREDGSVEAVIEGDADAVARVVSWMRLGPPRAAVDEVRVSEEPPVGETRFVVR
jgi:acylphosphatase